MGGEADIQQDVNRGLQHAGWDRADDLSQGLQMLSNARKTLRALGYERVVGGVIFSGAFSNEYSRRASPNGICRQLLAFGDQRICTDNSSVAHLDTGENGAGPSHGYLFAETDRQQFDLSHFEDVRDYSAFPSEGGVVVNFQQIPIGNKCRLYINPTTDAGAQSSVPPIDEGSTFQKLDEYRVSKQRKVASNGPLDDGVGINVKVSRAQLVKSQTFVQHDQNTNAAAPHQVANGQTQDGPKASESRIYPQIKMMGWHQCNAGQKSRKEQQEQAAQIPTQVDEQRQCSLPRVARFPAARA